ncbi:aminoglycoside phosphotransferase family protein [Amycolatopsis sp. La24]|uniref:aminoglycoside phosphotransferase family protein n=1 Tax=Amycolatopsis sp. La24 TaxID=3028304 RepID=UPI0023AE82DD|nr:aminoglycoside phosphotransferase family protein [Amycolatopsis sp. La24]
MPLPATHSADETLVKRLLAAQLPELAALPLSRLDPAGSDNVLYRLGDELSVRLPRGEWAAGQPEKESRWLPRLAPHLPLAIPEPVALGAPGEGYPWHWSVSRWLPGSPPDIGGLACPARIAAELARFVAALHRIPADPSLAAGPHNGFIGAPLARRDAETRAAIAETDVFDSAALTAVWDAALAAPPWPHPPVWVHGDLHPGNLLIADGQISAVLDFGGLGVGDPACDALIAWTLLPPSAREIFRAESGLDEDSWTRGRGYALSTGLNAYTAYAATNPRVAASTKYQIMATLADFQRA